MKTCQTIILILLCSISSRLVCQKIEVNYVNTSIEKVEIEDSIATKLWFRIMNPISGILEYRLKKDKSEILCLTLYTFRIKRKLFSKNKTYSYLSKSFFIPISAKLKEALINNDKLIDCQKVRNYSCLGFDGESYKLEFYQDENFNDYNYWCPKEQSGKNIQAQEIWDYIQFIMTLIKYKEYELKFGESLKQGQYYNYGDTILSIK